MIIIYAQKELCQDLKLINNWTMVNVLQFRPALSKQATEVIFCTKPNQPLLPSNNFNDNNIVSETFFKHLGMALSFALIII